MKAHSTHWWRHDIPGDEACTLREGADGWQIYGVALLAHEGKPCRLEYVIECDPGWITRSAVVTGFVGDQTIDNRITRDSEGRWLQNGCECDILAGCVDIDLNFSPSTNLLPIRRCGLAIGESVVVRAAWLRFPGFTMEPLEQRYTRLEEGLYRYESGGGRFTSTITVDDVGLVIAYGEFWSRER